MTSLSHLHSPKYKKNSSETGALVQRNNYKLVAILLTIFGVIILTYLIQVPAI